MQKTIAHNLADLRLDLKDSGALWSTAELTRCLERAVSDLSRFLPDKKRVELTVDAAVTSESFTSPAASSTTYFVAGMSIATSVDGAVCPLAANRPDVPRPVLVTLIDGGGSINQLVLIVKGMDADNKYIEESFYLEGGLIQTGVKYFAFVTEIEIDEIGGNSAGDVLTVGTGSHLGVWVQLANRFIKYQTESIAGYTRDTDYEMDYTGGRISLKTGTSMAVATAYTLAKYTKSRVDIDISSIMDGLIRIEHVQFPLEASAPHTSHAIGVWDKTLTLEGDYESQYETTDKQHVAIFYSVAHSMPDAQSPGSWPSFLDTTVQLAASAYALFMMALKYEHASVTAHEAVEAALVNVRIYLNNNTNEDAAALIKDITDNVAEIRTKIAVELGLVKTEVDLIKSLDIAETTEGAHDLLDTGRPTVNKLNDGGPTVPEKYAAYATTRLQISQTRGAQATLYMQEVASRFSDADMYLKQASGYNRIAEDFLAEAQALLVQIDGYHQLADRWKAEGVERRNEAWAIWRDHPQYAPNYALTSVKQNP